MIKARRSPLHREDLQNEVESNYMATPNVSLSTPPNPNLQTQDCRPLKASDETMYNTSSVADIGFIRPYKVQQQSLGVYQEVEETLNLDDEIVHNESTHSLFSGADIYFSWLTDAIQQLQEVYKEVTETCTLDDEIDPVPDSAYHDAFRLLELLDYCNVPMPDIGWLMDGGIGFEWRSQDTKGIATMSIYGDSPVVYGASHGDSRRIKGTCRLSNIVLLDRFFPVVKDLCSQ